jgi:Fanconi anemia group J protein
MQHSYNSYRLQGIDVKFPFDAYPSQIELMDAVIKAADTKSNALLELPTGSGKSMALLCAALVRGAKLMASFLLFFSLYA